MTCVAFIGLGNMGLPMAGHLLSAGFDLTVCSRSSGPVEQMAAQGARAASTPAEAVREADVVAVMVPDSPDVRDVLTGSNGVFGAARPGTLIVDFSTIRPDVERELAQQAAEHGLRFLDAPVSGGQQGAIAATLSIMVGGASEDFEAGRPMFEAVGTTIVHVGALGSGQTVKAANQLIVGGNIAILAEAIVFLEAHGVDTEAALEVLGGGLAGSTVLSRRGASMRERNFTPGFRGELHHKDMSIVIDAARQAGVVIPLGSLVGQLFAALKAEGYGGLDHTALLKITEQLAGRG